MNLQMAYEIDVQRKWHRAIAKVNDHIFLVATPLNEPDYRSINSLGEELRKLIERTPL